MKHVRAVRDLAGLARDHHALGLVERCGGLIGIYDDREVLRYCNAAFREAYGIMLGEEVDWPTLMRRNFLANRGTVIRTDDIDAWISSVRSRRGKTPRRTYESDLHDGRWIWVVETMDDDGWIVYNGLDVSALRQSERHLRHARDRALQDAQTDALTGISNRKHILDHLADMIAGDGQVGQTVGYACLMDLDHFKAINDQRGHVTGDQVLIGFARRVRQAVRLRDAFGRVGGEEFLLLLPDVGLSDAMRIVAAVADAVAASPLVPDQPDLRVTFSGGLCPVTPACAPGAIYERADAALYRAKMTGRNRVMLADAATVPPKTVSQT